MGDGGMLTSYDPAMADRLRLCLRATACVHVTYHKVVGINSRLDTFQAAVLRVKLRHLPDAIQKRTTAAATIRQIDPGSQFS